MSKEQEQGQSKIFKTYLKSENTHKHVITRNNTQTIYQMKKKPGTDSILREEKIQ